MVLVGSLLETLLRVIPYLQKRIKSERRGQTQPIINVVHVDVLEQVLVSNVTNEVLLDLVFLKPLGVRFPLLFLEFVLNISQFLHLIIRKYFNRDDFTHHYVAPLSVAPIGMHSSSVHN